MYLNVQPIDGDAPDTILEVIAQLYIIIEYFITKLQIVQKTVNQTPWKS